MAKQPVVSERQAATLAFIEEQINTGNPPPNTVELAEHTGFSTGEIARHLEFLEHQGFITRIKGTRRNIRLCMPSVKMASDDILASELISRGYLVRKVQ